MDVAGAVDHRGVPNRWKNTSILVNDTMKMKLNLFDPRMVRLISPLKRRARPFATATTSGPPGSQWTPSPVPATIDNDYVARLASKPLHPLILADLVRHGHPPLSESDLLASANFTLSILPNRLAHRIHALRNLPFIVVSNPYIARIYNIYIHSLSTLLPYQEKLITSLSDEMQFTEVMADLVQTHSNTIPILARGFLECKKYISPAEVTAFLDEHLRARIGTRLIAEQHIALHLSSKPRSGTKAELQLQEYISSTHVGVIDTALRPADIIRQCESTVGEICELKYGVRPRVVINGQPDTRIAHVPTHLEYIATELLKNAFRATIETGQEREPIEITIAASPECPAREQQSAKLVSNHTDAVHSEVPPSVPALTIRIRDHGGGIPPTILPHIWAYSFTTFSEDDLPSSGNGTTDALNTISNVPGSGNSLAGLGYGLPLGRAYAEYFGGALNVQSLSGWGTDVYLRLRGLDEV